jgi:hypothetical protein
MSWPNGIIELASLPYRLKRGVKLKLHRLRAHLYVYFSFWPTTGG